MKTLVTGGAGFIGSHLVEDLLARGDDVVVMDTFKRGNKIPKHVRKNSKLVVQNADVRDKDAIFEFAKDVDIVFHFAAVLGVDVVADNPVETMETETISLQNIAKAAVEFNIGKIVYASTSGVYGKSVISSAVDEDFSVSPKSSYAIAKRYNEIYLKSLYEEKGVNSVTLRFFNVYGTRQDCRMVIPKFFEQALKNQSITVYGTGKQTRDFTYIKDVTYATIEAAKRVSGCEIFNVANEKECTIGDLAKVIVDTTGSESEIVNIDSPSKRYDFDVDRRFGCSSKLFKYIGFKPDTKLDVGLKSVYESLTR